jgi:tetratricopeptide (TPR) repeat protein
VYTRNPETGQQVNRKGRIVSWRGDTLQLEANSSTREIRSDWIIRVETTWDENYLLAQLLLNKRDLQSAMTALQAVIVDEPREWARHQAQAELIPLLVYHGQAQQAVEQFVRLIAEDPRTRFIGAIPLNWQGGEVPPALTATARQWRESQSPWLSLLGASWTMSGGDQPEAIKVMQRWSQDIEPQIAHMASAQLWRLQQLNATPTEIARWERQWERIPSDLQAGPALMIAQAHLRQNQADQAFLWYMRIPILHNKHYQLSVSALQQAALILKNQQQIPAAQRLYQEIIRDFPGSPAAEQAQSFLQPSETGR